MTRHVLLAKREVIRLGVLGIAIAFGAVGVDLLFGGPTIVTWLALIGAALIAAGTSLRLGLSARNGKNVDTPSAASAARARSSSGRWLVETLSLVVVAGVLTVIRVSDLIFGLFAAATIGAIVVWEITAQMRERRKGDEHH
jgi:hypothetical protein